jgi:hypothetical protein
MIPEGCTDLLPEYTGVDRPSATFRPTDIGRATGDPLVLALFKLRPKSRAIVLIDRRAMNR